MMRSTFVVSGIVCRNCADAITAELTRLPEVVGVEVDVPSAAVAVTSREPIESARLRRAVERAGYAIDDEPVPTPSPDRPS